MKHTVARRFVYHDLAVEEVDYAVKETLLPGVTASRYPWARTPLVRFPAVCLSLRKSFIPCAACVEDSQIP